MNEFKSDKDLLITGRNALIKTNSPVRNIVYQDILRKYQNKTSIENYSATVSKELMKLVDEEDPANKFLKLGENMSL